MSAVDPLDDPSVSAIPPPFSRYSLGLGLCSYLSQPLPRHRFSGRNTRICLYHFFMVCGHGLIFLFLALGLLRSSTAFLRSTSNIGRPTTVQTNACPRPTINECCPRMVILCGLPGSGKSSFCRRLQDEVAANKSERWVVLSQDTLGTLEACETLCREALQNKERVIIDRININAQHRELWSNIAKSAGLTHIWMLELAVPKGELERRCRNRHGLLGPDVKSPEALQIHAELELASVLWEPPTSTTFSLSLRLSDKKQIEKIILDLSQNKTNNRAK